MARRVYVKVIGFSEEERHSLNTLFRLSEQCRTMYQLWVAGCAEPARLALLDGDSYEAQVEAQAWREAGMHLLWVGAQAPGAAIHAFQRPIDWPAVLQVMDDLCGAEESVDLDVEHPDRGWPQTMLHKRALIVSANRDQRLYLRARLALARLTLADEAVTANQALQLVDGNQYDVAVVDFGLPDMSGWALLRELRHGPNAIENVVLTKDKLSFPERLRARLAGAAGLLDKPPLPHHLQALLEKV